MRLPNPCVTGQNEIRHRPVTDWEGPLPTRRGPLRGHTPSAAFPYMITAECLRVVPSAFCPIPPRSAKRHTVRGCPWMSVDLHDRMDAPRAHVDLRERTDDLRAHVDLRERAGCSATARGSSASARGAPGARGALRDRAGVLRDRVQSGRSVIYAAAALAIHWLLAICRTVCPQICQLWRSAGRACVAICRPWLPVRWPAWRPVAAGDLSDDLLAAYLAITQKTRTTTMIRMITPRTTAVRVLPMPPLPPSSPDDETAEVDVGPPQACWPLSDPQPCC